MQTLGVVPRLFPLVESGEKTSTIRWRETPIVTGPMRYVCDGDASRTAIVEVTRVTRMRLDRAAAFLGRQDEWPASVMLEGMREHYPDITLGDEVVVIEHKTPRESRRASRADS